LVDKGESEAKKKERKTEKSERIHIMESTKVTPEQSTPQQITDTWK
jgi:hypothetical protein